MLVLFHASLFNFSMYAEMTASARVSQSSSTCREFSAFQLASTESEP